MSPAAFTLTRSAQPQRPQPTARLSAGRSAHARPQPAARDSARDSAVTSLSVYTEWDEDHETYAAWVSGTYLRAESVELLLSAITDVERLAA